MAIMLFALPVAAMADGCPKDGEPVKTIPYTKTFRCTVSSIVVEGETGSVEYQECPGDEPAARAAAYYTGGSKPRLPLPAINSLFPKSDKDSSARNWIAGKAHCQSDNSIIIDYWAEGGCDGCERSVQYIFSDEGALQKTRLIRQ